LKTAAVIYWDTLGCNIGMELLGEIFSVFKEKMESANLEYENVHFEARAGNDLGCFSDKLCVKTIDDGVRIEKIFYESAKPFESLLTKEQLEVLKDHLEYTYVHTLAYCVVCHTWESWEDFTFDEDLNLYMCSFC
jgi:hypothetical protein